MVVHSASNNVAESCGWNPSHFLKLKPNLTTTSVHVHKAASMPKRGRLRKVLTRMPYMPYPTHASRSTGSVAGVCEGGKATSAGWKPRA